MYLYFIYVFICNICSVDYNPAIKIKKGTIPESRKNDLIYFFTLYLLIFTVIFHIHLLLIFFLFYLGKTDSALQMQQNKEKEYTEMHVNIENETSNKG